MTPMTIETTTQEAPAEEEKAEAPDMTEEAAAEAPAEAEDDTAGAREPWRRTDTEGQKDGVSVQQALLLDTTLGPVKLGMPSGGRALDSGRRPRRTAASSMSARTRAITAMSTWAVQSEQSIRIISVM